MPTPNVITYTCPRCKRPLEVDDDLAGADAACPHCGSVGKVPRRSVRPDGVPIARPVQPHQGARKTTSNDVEAGAPPLDRAQALGLPPDSGPEVPVLSVHPATFRAKPYWGTIILLMFVGGLASALALVFREQRAGAWACFALAVAGAGWWGVWKLRTMTTTLTITNKRATARRGFFAKATREVLHDQIQDLQVRQTFFQRFCGVGTIGISSSAEAGVEIILDDLPNPTRIRKAIDAYRNIG